MSEPADLTPEEIAERAFADAPRAEARRLEIADLRWLIMNENPAGRRVLRRVIYELAGVEDLGWTADPATRAAVDFHAGARNLGLVLLRLAREACPTLGDNIRAESDPIRKDSTQ